MVESAFLTCLNEMASDWMFTAVAIAPISQKIVRKKLFNRQIAHSIFADRHRFCGKKMLPHQF